MKLSCNVAKDLLPLYHDGVCSDESRGLVEGHLKECESCRTLLKELRGELELPHQAPDDLAPLEKIGAGVKRGKKRAWLKGAAAVLAAVLVVGAALAGLNGFENRRYQERFARFAEGYEPYVTDEEMYVACYDWISGSYRFQVAVPAQGYRGVAQVQEYKWTKDPASPSDLVQISLSVHFSDKGGYLYQITIENCGNTYASRPGEPEETDWVWETVTLDQNGQTVDDPDWDKETLARKTEVIETYRTEILNIIAAAEREWPFLMEE